VVKEPDVPAIEAPPAMPSMDDLVGDVKPGQIRTVEECVSALKDPAGRQEALDSLMVLRAPSAVPALTALLASSEEMPVEIRGRVCQAICLSLDPKAAFDILLPVVSRSADWEWLRKAEPKEWTAVAQLVAHLAGVLRHTPAAPALIAACSRVEPWDLPPFLRALGRLKAREAVPVCVRALGRHADISTSAVEALGEIGERSAVPDIIRAVERRLDARPSAAIFCAEAARALGRLRADTPQAIEILERMLTHPDEEVRGLSAEALGRTGTARQAVLRNAADRETIPWVRSLMRAAADSASVTR
jgi:HEAT repeat protein